MTTATADFAGSDPMRVAPSGPRVRLAIMMFLQFFIWGAWLPLIFGYLPSLKFSPLEQSWILNAFALASFTGMFFSNQFADRYFAAQKFLSVSHLIGGVAILGLAFVKSFWPFFGLMLIHCLFYVPTISITNSIAFANLKDAKRDFGLVRLFGTIGWIAASVPFVFLLVDWTRVPDFGSVSFGTWLGEALGNPKTGSALIEATTYTFIAAGVASIILAAFSLLLPHTPPKPAKVGGESLAWLEAMKLLKVPFILVLFVVTFFDAAVHQCYFIYTDTFLKSVGVPANWIMPVMSIGQIAEIGTMAVLGLVLKRLGWRTTMIVGILGHALRFGVFALAPLPALAITVNLLHGVCYAFFFATVYIFVDEFFPKDARTSAQGLFNFLILGFGPFVANFVWPMVGASSVVGVPTQQPDPATVVVANEYRMVTVKGTAAPGAELKVTFQDGKDPVTSDSKAGDDGKWSIGTQYLSRSTDGHYKVVVEPRGFPAGATLPATNPVLQPSTNPTTLPAAPAISTVERIDFRKLFLAPSATALAAAFLLLIFFRPPKMSRSEGSGAVATPH